MPAPRQCLCDCDCGCKASAHKDSATQTWVDEGTQTASFPVPVWEEEPRQAADNLSCSQDSDNDDNDDNVESPDNQDSDKVGMRRSSKSKKDPVSNAAVSPVAPNDRLDPLTPKRTIPHWSTESLHNKSMQLPETSTLTLHQAGHNVTHLRVSPSGSLDIVVRGADTSIASNSLIVTESPVVKRSQKKSRSQATRRAPPSRRKALLRPPAPPLPPLHAYREPGASMGHKSDAGTNIKSVKDKSNTDSDCENNLGVKCAKLRISTEVPATSTTTTRSALIAKIIGAEGAEEDEETNQLFNAAGFATRPLTPETQYERVIEREPAVGAFEHFVHTLESPPLGAIYKEVKLFLASHKLICAEWARDVSHTQPSEKTDLARQLDSRTVDFLKRMDEQFAAHPCFVNASDETLAALRDGMEKYTLCRIHDQVFAQDPEESTVS
ncbi:Vacuolar protein sorting-associated protein 9A [Hondaea fermentalgiana]|uniref:Vacuolar protein sorting-associated protein 9A n=1 Tax=Hondaea fermentalgiana TaxID=2315210 RepID=A0A2R5GX58_9STRA|nr:Vacuolar protein sorting-associated protein 9A [Hondaea fermentalgiana]|eukprot:GBG33273.1 Vacuolar protein sorting-associated protein 9A [Hondaea fermentalgiana]